MVKSDWGEGLYRPLDQVVQDENIPVELLAAGSSLLPVGEPGNERYAGVGSD